MGRKGAKTYGNQAAIFKPKSNDKLLEEEKPDSSSQKFYQDEVDQFHSDKDKIPLKNLNRSQAASSDEEVYKIGQDSEDEDEEEEGSAEYDKMEEDVVDDMHSDIDDKEDENDYLPSADNWGKKKQSFYSTDYVDKDYGGYLSESDEEAAKLEEIEAKTLQKRMAEQMDEEDFELFQFKSAAAHSEQKEGDKTIEAFEKVDVSKLTETEKLEHLKRQSPEFLGLLEDFKEKYKILETQLRPVVEAIKSGKIPSTSRLNFIQLRFEAYSNYLINVNFYFLLKANQSSLKNHPIIDRIIEWKNILNRVDQKCENLNENVEYLADKLKMADNNAINELNFISEDESGANCHRLKMDASSSSIVVVKDKKKRKKKLEKNGIINGDELDNENGDIEEDLEGDGKRAATYQILKNKGTTPKRKKEERNPRVKHRRKFQKALHKKRSQVPDVKRELKKYGGEERGIKPNVIKSVKLH